MTEAEYRAIPALSFSSMKDLEISAYRFWFLHVNPNRPAPTSSPEMDFGHALHCAVLQPSEVFEAQYVQAIDVSQIEGCLETIGDMRQWLTDKGFKPKGTKKDEMVAQVQAVDPDWPILSVIEARNFAANQGKTVISVADWARMQGCVESLRSEPRINEILKEGRPEVEFFCNDAATKAPLKCRIDWLNPWCTFDLKTFSVKRRMSVDETVANAIWYEGYLKQCVLYTGIRYEAEAAAGAAIVKHKPFVQAFVESDPPHEVRLRQFNYGGENLYFNQTALEVRVLIDQYAYCVETYGTEPWRDAQEIMALQDEEFRQLSWT